MSFALQVVDPPNKFHLALHVHDLAKSIPFFEKLLAIAPAKVYPDYAKFELEIPPVILSLNPFPFTVGGNVQAIGFRLHSLADFHQYQQRLQTQQIEYIQTGNALQLHDPDGNSWRIEYVPDHADAVTQVVEVAAATNEAEPTGELSVVYRGPFKELIDRDQRLYHRGKPVVVPFAVWEDLKHGPMAESFFFYSAATTSACGH